MTYNRDMFNWSQRHSWNIHTFHSYIVSFVHYFGKGIFIDVFVWTYTIVNGWLDNEGKQCYKFFGVEICLWIKELTAFNNARLRS